MRFLQCALRCSVSNMAAPQTVYVKLGEACNSSDAHWTKGSGSNKVAYADSTKHVWHSIQELVVPLWHVHAEYSALQTRYGTAG
jgi:hypothetical protein